MSHTIVRTDLVRPLEQIIHVDIGEDEADWLVMSGAAEHGPEYTIPPAVYLLRDIEIRGLTYPAGAMVHVGQEVTEAEALALIRGFRAEGGGVASVPQGGIG